MNRNRPFILLGAVALFACATLAHDARATGPTPPLAPLGIHVGNPEPLRTTSTAIALDQNTPYEHTFASRGSRFYVAVKGAPASGTVTFYSSSDAGNTWTYAIQYQTNIGLPQPYYLHCAALAVDAGNPDIVYLTYYADGNFGSQLGFVMGRMYGTVLSINPSTHRILAQSYNDLGNLMCPDIVSPSPGSVVVADILESNTGDSVGTFTSLHDYGAGLASTATLPSPYTSNSNTNTVYPTPAGCYYASNDASSAPRLVTSGNGTVCVTYVEKSGCTPANSGGRFVQCSHDSGATWTRRTVLDTKGGGSGVASVAGAISPSGNNVALAWVTRVTGADEIAMAFSNTAGATFLPANPTLPQPFNIMRPYPSASRTRILAGSVPRGRSSPGRATARSGSGRRSPSTTRC